MSRIINSPWSPGIATVLALIACYGTGLLVATLSLLGISLALDEQVWAGAVSALAVLVTFLIALSSWHRRIVPPAAIAVIGCVLILWTMYGSYSRVVEVVGFVFLAFAAVLDRRARPAVQSPASDVTWIEVPELAVRLGQNSAPVVLDVRGPDEFLEELGHISGARNIALGDVPRRLDEIEALKTQPIVLVCKTQMRSAKVGAILKEAGFRDVAVLRGGMVEWTRQGRPVATA